jgi:hypothetical protein
VAIRLNLGFLTQEATFKRGDSVTRSALHEELSSILNVLPSNRRDLSHALSRIRKVLEYDGARGVCWALVFFCDWILHTKLDRKAARKLLTALDERLGRSVPGKPESFDPDGMVLNILSFELFRQHLWNFLETNDLPTVWVADDFVWRKTAILYGELAKDTPLIMSRNDYQFKYLRKAVITSCEPSEAIVAANPGQKYSGFRWEFTLSDDRTFKLSHTFNLPEPPSNWQMKGRGI